MKSIELRQSRAALVEDVRKIQTAASGRMLNTEERSKIETIEKSMSEIEANIAIVERQEKREAELAARPENRVVGSSGNDKEKAEAEYRSNFNRYLKTGETRDLSADTAAAGGNIVAPQQFVTNLLKKLDDMVFVRAGATKYQLGSFANLGIPTLSANPDDADWTTEVQSVTDDSSLAFGKRTMAPNVLSKLIKVSMKLLEVGTLPAESIVLDRLAYKFAIAQEKSFLTGSGSGQPLGLFTASANGISTGRDLATSNTSTAITADNLFAQVYNVKAQYRKNASWAFHRDAVRQIRLLKDSQNRYLWQPAVTAGQPDTLLGFAVNESEYIPNTFTTGLYVGLFGDLSKYWICDQMNYTVQRLVELYAANNNVGFIGRMSTDGAPVDELAFSRVKLG